MKPAKDGIYEWFEEDGTKRLVHVCDVGVPGHPFLRVYWWGGYYSVEADDRRPAEWPDRWGHYVGNRESVPEEQLYQMPTPKQREEILKNYKLRQL